MVRDTISESVQKFDLEILRVKKSERLNLARELHDEVGQYITAIHYYATAIMRVSETSSIDHNASAIDKITSELSDIIHKKIKQLRSNAPTKIELNFVENISQMIRAWERRNACISVDVHISGTFTDVDSNVLFTAYRLTQECLTNIARHAKASSVAIRIRRTGDDIVLNVVDNGNGFDLDRNIGRFGIVGMRERVAECDGTFDIETSRGAGVNVSVYLPCMTSSKGEKQ